MLQKIILPYGKCLYIHANGIVQEGRHGLTTDDSPTEEKEWENEEITPSNEQNQFFGGQMYSLSCKPEDLLFSNSAKSTHPDFIVPNMSSQESKQVVKETKQLSMAFIRLAEEQEEGEGEKDDETETVERYSEKHLEIMKLCKISVVGLAKLLADSAATDEMSCLSRSAPSLLQPEIWAECLQLLDRDHDGTLDWNELKHLYYMAKLFHLVDSDSSGTVELSEIQHAVKGNPQAFPRNFFEGDASQLEIASR